MRPANKKDARAGTGASGTSLLLTYQKHSKGIALAQHDSNAHFDEIALAIRGQQAGARFVADVVAPTSLGMRHEPPPRHRLWC